MAANFRAAKFLLEAVGWCDIFQALSTLTEIETAADALASDEKEELLRFLAMRLRKERANQAPRRYAPEELASMLAEDEADGQKFRQNR